MIARSAIGCYGRGADFRSSYASAHHESVVTPDRCANAALRVFFNSGSCNFPRATWPVNRLYDDIGRALAQPDVRERLTATGLELVPQSPGQFHQFIAAETKRWAQAVKDARMQTE